LAPPKHPLREDSDPSPDIVAVPGGGGTPPDHLYGIYQRLTSVESSQAYMTATVDDSKTKIETLSREFTEAKTRFDTLLPIAKSIAKTLKGILAAICLFLLSLLGMWVKHHFGW
jgi:hypothetical protein